MTGPDLRIPDWLLAEVAEWPQDAWGVHHARLLLRDGTVVAPVAILPSGDIQAWGAAPERTFEPDDIVAVEPADH
jgi:hypothetical protein